MNFFGQNICSKRVVKFYLNDWYALDTQCMYALISIPNYNISTLWSLIPHDCSELSCRRFHDTHTTRCWSCHRHLTSTHWFLCDLEEISTEYIDAHFMIWYLQHFLQNWRVPHKRIDYKPTLLHVMVWGRQATINTLVHVNLDICRHMALLWCPCFYHTC